MTNTAMLGALVKVTKIVSLDSIINEMNARWAGS